MTQDIAVTCFAQGQNASLASQVGACSSRSYQFHLNCCNFTRGCVHGRSPLFRGKNVFGRQPIFKLSDRRSRCRNLSLASSRQALPHWLQAAHRKFPRKNMSWSSPSPSRLNPSILESTSKPLSKSSGQATGPVLTGPATTNEVSQLLEGRLPGAGVLC